MESFLKYSSLQGHREFRLVNIQPGTKTDLLSLELSHSSLNEKNPPVFEALSYVWGSSGEMDTAQVQYQRSDGTITTSQLLIGQNLAVALRYIRRQSAARTIWADAVCIDQKNLPERSQQVLLMGDIYRLASGVIAFLGPEADNSRAALNLLEKAGNMVEVEFLSGKVQSSPMGHLCGELGWADMQRPPPLGREELASINHLLGREWFERLWIRQEIGLGGPKGVIQCGHSCVTWSLFCAAVFIIHRKPMTQALMSESETKSFKSRLQTADNVALHAMGGYSLLSLRKQAGHAKCADPRDRLYGLLSQLPHHDRADILPDYTKTVSDIYIETARTQIRRHRRLDIISQCELDERTPTFTLPSWVPNWSVPTDTADVHDITPELFHLGPSFSYIDSVMIHAMGASIGRVVCVIHLDHEKMQSSSDRDTMGYLRRLLCGLAENEYLQAASLERCQHFSESCCRTLWLNTFAERWVPPVAHQPQYHKCLRLIKTLASSDDLSEVLDGASDMILCLQRCREACVSRALFITEDGHLGAAAESVAVGDEVIALFGCFTPMVLRPVSSSTDKYRVVSECYLDGQMRGESLLGDLPWNLHGVLNGKGSTELRSAAFMDIDTKVIYQEDPRNEHFLAALQERGFLKEPSLAELERVGAWDVLSSAGFPVKTFKLV